MSARKIFFILLTVAAVPALAFLFIWTRGPKGLVPRFEMGWAEGEKFSKISAILKLPLIWPGSMCIEGNRLYLTEFWNGGIRILKIYSDGRLYIQSVFGEEKKNTRSFSALRGLAIKGGHLYVTDTGNHRIQVLKIQPDGDLIPKFVFGKKGEGLGEFSAPLGLAIKGGHLYVADSGNRRIQALEIKY